MLPPAHPAESALAQSRRSGGTQLYEPSRRLLGRIATRSWRSANSFSASPTANPVGARKRKGWFVVLQSCDRLVPSRSNLHPVLPTWRATTAAAAGLGPTRPRRPRPRLPRRRQGLGRRSTQRQPSASACSRSECSGSDVHDLQRDLTALGFTVPRRAVHGPDRQRLKAFQRRYGLTVDGVAGPTTIRS